MTIDEAIKHAKDTANANYEMASAYHDDFGVYGKEETRCRECAEEHEQLAEWLEELKKLRLGVNYLNEKAYQQGRADENNRIIGFLKFNRYAIVDNNGDYYSIEELEDMLRGQSDENNV